MAEPNFLLGKGERLVHGIPLTKGGDSKPLPYTFEEAQSRLSPRALTASQAIDALPSAACPNDEAVAAITIHPAQIAKSYYPDTFLAANGLRTVGSHSASVVTDDSRTATTELYISASRLAFRRLASTLGQARASVSWADDLRKIEDIRLVPFDERIKPIHSDDQELLLEVVLHGAGNSHTAALVLNGFERYLASIRVPASTSRRIDTSNLSFVAIRADRSRIVDISRFSFLRTIREMPRLRHLEPAVRDYGYTPETFECPVTPMHALDRRLSAAVFDGGLPDVPALRHCVVIHDDIDGLGDPVEEFVQHGLAVTSAMLYGPLHDGQSPGPPFALVHHYRVLDRSTYDDPQHELYSVLDRISGVLRHHHFDFVSCSLGPDIPADDDDVHPWTATFDEVAANGTVLITSAAGNTGESPSEYHLNRLQPPADGVNILGVGACDCEDDNWQRAPYSSIGRGRSPGVVKPDGVAFGGSLETPFWVIDYYDHDLTAPTNGTSVAAPYVLRAGLGIRAVLGPEITPLAVKALLLHNCDLDDRDVVEVGWGRICTDVQRLVTCGDNSVHVIYQDFLEPKRWVQAAIPMLPANEMEGLVDLSATICIAAPVDPHHPLHYTRAGLDIVFRRNRNNIKENKTTAPSTSFFRPIEGVSEADLRADWHKWETVRRASDSFQGKTLRDPVLDIHYNPRKDAKDSLAAEPIPYAMVISVTASKVEDFYNRIVNRYRSKLEVLLPMIRVPIRL